MNIFELKLIQIFKKNLLALAGIAAAVVAIHAAVTIDWFPESQSIQTSVVLGRFPVKSIPANGRGQINLKVASGTPEDQHHLCGDYAVVTLKNIGLISLDKISIQVPGSGVIQIGNEFVAVNKDLGYMVKSLRIAETVNMTIWYSSLEDKPANIFVSHFIGGSKRSFEVNLSESNFGLTGQSNQATWKDNLIFVLGSLFVLTLIYNSTWGGWLRNKINKVDDRKVPALISYRGDIFFGYRWSWHYDKNYNLQEPIYCFCPKCDYQILPRPSKQGNFVFVCDDCGYLHKQGRVHFKGELEQKVILKAQQNIRSKQMSYP
ncbi:MAG: hypothetical protein V3V74_07010 [Nitrosomonadaceae bacterium]